MKVELKNTSILHDIPQNIPEEIIDTIISTKDLKIERIVSQGQCSPDGFWYDQKDNEWVIIIKGKAILEFATQEEIILNEGEYINIPAHKKHRVKWTDPQRKTIWLAIYYTNFR